MLTELKNHDMQNVIWSMDHLNHMWLLLQLTIQVQNLLKGTICDMKRVYVFVCVGSWVWFMGVCASHADVMNNGGHLKYMCLQNANPNNKEG